MSKWTIKEFEITGPKLFESRTFEDSRGFFVERFHEMEMRTLGLDETFVQDNFSRSNEGVLRGLHFQWEPVQGKLVTCTNGRILDVIVDIRCKSATFGKHLKIELSGDQPSWFWVPAGFAHGFVVLGTEPADVWYRVNGYYNGKCEGSIRWDDPELAISWPVAKPNLSGKDADAQSFSSYKANPVF